MDSSAKCSVIILIIDATPAAAIVAGMGWWGCFIEEGAMDIPALEFPSQFLYQGDGLVLLCTGARRRL